MEKYTKQASENFARKLEQVKATKPVVNGVTIDNEVKIAKILGLSNSGPFTGIKQGTRAVTLEQLATFCDVFDFDISQMIYNKKRKIGGKYQKQISAIIDQLETIK